MLVHHRLEAVVGGHRGQRGVVGRGDGAAPARQRPTGLPCWRDPWSASSAQAGALTTPPLPEGGELRKHCVEGGLERGLAGRECGVRGV